MKCVALALSALVALGSAFAFCAPASAATALNGAKLDPLNLIDDALEHEALAAYARHASQRPFKGDEIVIVDYSLPSSVRRLYIVNIRTGAVEAHYVAHGRGSDPAHTRMAVRFSDAETSGMSSVGAFRGLERYRSGTHGPALRLAGLDGTNASAFQRLIVFHTAPYFDPENGRFGRSCGCFVVTKDQMKRVYDVIADGGFLYAGPARLHDASATRARDCNTECGNRCPDAPLLAKATPAPARPAAPVVTASVAPPVAPQPEPTAAPPAVMAALKPEPEAPARAARPAFDAPRPMAKPKLSAPVEMAAFDAPVPRLKPALDAVTIDGEARFAAEEILNRRHETRLVAAAEPPAASSSTGLAVLDAPLPAAKPAALAASVPLPAIVETGHEPGAPVPLAKPMLVAELNASPQLDAAPLIPVVVPGQTPVPAAKPPGLRQTADAGGRT